MTISTWLMILALGVGSGTSQLSGSNFTAETTNSRPGLPVSHCWINGVWYNPCPIDDYSPPPDPPSGPDEQVP